MKGIGNMTKENELHTTKEETERVILVGCEIENAKSDVCACLDELELLAVTAGAEAVGRLTQKRERIHPGHYIGSGKIEELKLMIDALDATGVICDDELSPSQIRNMEKLLETKIMDRTMVILDIFASRAFSSEGKIQVELAQLKYRLSRLSGIGASMSRLGGGIGTRGPGEKKLETDRRYIKERISELKKELEDVRTHRKLLRTQRDKKGMVSVALVGYTNAGKSTILNGLTNANVLEEDMLFATLDTTTRNVKLPGGTNILLSDTVGFIQKLSHHLVEAFKATLEELKYADILLHVVDASNTDCQLQMKIVYETLESLECGGKPVITVFNKIDKNVDLPIPTDKLCDYSIKISAKNEQDLVLLNETVENAIKASRKTAKILIPYTKGNLLSLLHGKCEIISEEYTPDGTLIEAYINYETENRFKKYIVL